VLTVARLEVRPTGKDVPDDGVTMALIRAITIAPARRYVVNKAQIEARQRAWTKRSRRGRPGLLTRPLFDELKREGKTRSRSTVRAWIARAKSVDGRNLSGSSTLTITARGRLS
jgi:hypothetical protein